MKTSLLILHLFALAGCGLLEGSDIPDLRLEADRPSYQPGEEVMLTLVNSSGHTFMVHPSLCDAVLQRWEAPTWRPVYAGPALVCTDVGVELKPGKQVIAQEQLSETLSMGQYRYMYELRQLEESERSRREERIELYTKVFEVEE